MKNSNEIEFRVGLFIALGVSLICVAVLVLGSESALFSRLNSYSARFQDVQGLIKGAKVVLNGIRVGIVDSVDILSGQTGVQVDFSVDKKYVEWLRGDSESEIATQGVLGDKYLVITAGSSNESLLPPRSFVKVREGGGLTQLLSRSEQVMESFKSITKNLDRIFSELAKDNRSKTIFEGLSQSAKNFAALSTKLNRLELDQVSQELNLILKKINNGKGTLGALVNDPGLYEDLRLLMGGVNRNRIMRNLVRKTIQDAQSQKPDKASPKEP